MDLRLLIWRDFRKESRWVMKIELSAPANKIETFSPRWILCQVNTIYIMLWQGFWICLLVLFGLTLRSNGKNRKSKFRITYHIFLHPFLGWAVSTSNYGSSRTTCNSIKREALALVLSWEFCESFRNNTLFIEHLR